VRRGSAGQGVAGVARRPRASHGTRPWGDSTLDVGYPPAHSDWRARFAAYLNLPEARERLQALTGSEVEQLQQELAALPLHQHTAHLALWGRARGYWFNDVTPELLQLETSLWRHTEALEDSFTLPQLQTDVQEIRTAFFPVASPPCRPTVAARRAARQVWGWRATRPRPREWHSRDRSR
jgi:hypothetical protein